MLADPDFDPTFDQLLDVTRVARLEVSTNQARILAGRQIVSHDSLRAIVATQSHIFGVGRMVGGYHESLAQVHIYSMEEALNWLGRSLHVSSR